MRFLHEKKSQKGGKQKKNNKGITLVALVITIIVLLILAGVSLSLVLGENGVLSQAKNAKVKTDTAAAKEKLLLDLSEYEIARLTGEKPELEEFLEEKGYEVEEVENTTYSSVKVDEEEFLVSNQGKAAEREEVEEVIANAQSQPTLELSATRITLNDFIYSTSNSYIYELTATTSIENPSFNLEILNSPPDPIRDGDYLFFDMTAGNYARLEVYDKFKKGEITVRVSIPGTDLSATCIVDTDIGGSNGPT